MCSSGCTVCKSVIQPSWLFLKLTPSSLVCYKLFFTRRDEIGLGSSAQGRESWAELCDEEVNNKQECTVSHKFKSYITSNWMLLHAVEVKCKGKSQ